MRFISLSLLLSLLLSILFYNGFIILLVKCHWCHFKSCFLSSHFDWNGSLAIFFSSLLPKSLKLRRLRPLLAKWERSLGCTRCTCYWVVPCAPRPVIRAEDERVTTGNSSLWYPLGEPCPGSDGAIAVAWRFASWGYPLGHRVESSCLHH